MGFQFSLAAVLRVRGITEEQEERLLQKILFEITQTAEAIGNIEKQIAEANAFREGSLGKPVSGYHLHASYEAIKALKQSKKELEEKLEKLKVLRDKQIKVYEAARRNREMLTDMRETQQAAYETEVARYEQRTLDDNHIARRGRV